MKGILLLLLLIGCAWMGTVMSSGSPRGEKAPKGSSKKERTEAAKKEKESEEDFEKLLVRYARHPLISGGRRIPYHRVFRVNSPSITQAWKRAKWLLHFPREAIPAGARY